jgi:hypothetical protein
LDSLAQRILRALDGIHYGSVEIVVHDSRVVQIERKEKLRLEPPPQGPRR